jgi:hypothetical protein
VKGRIWNAAAAFDPGTGDRDQNRARPLMPSAGNRYLRWLETNSNLEHVLTLAEDQQRRAHNFPVVSPGVRVRA